MATDSARRVATRRSMPGARAAKVSSRRLMSERSCSVSPGTPVSERPWEAARAAVSCASVRRDSSIARAVSTVCAWASRSALNAASFPSSPRRSCASSLRNESLPASRSSSARSRLIIALKSVCGAFVPARSFARRVASSSQWLSRSFISRSRVSACESCLKSTPAVLTKRKMSAPRRNAAPSAARALRKLRFMAGVSVLDPRRPGARATTLCKSRRQWSVSGITRRLQM